MFRLICRRARNLANCALVTGVRSMAYGRKTHSTCQRCRLEVMPPPIGGRILIFVGTALAHPDGRDEFEFAIDVNQHHIGRHFALAIAPAAGDLRSRVCHIGRCVSKSALASSILWVARNSVKS